MFSTRTREFASKKSVGVGARPKAESTEPRQPNPLWQQLATRVQPKLRVSAPDDPYEREADVVTDRVMRMRAPVVQRSCGACATASTPCPQCERERKEEPPAIHRKPHDAVDSAGPSLPDGFL